jgi:hypothetical protein
LKSFNPAYVRSEAHGVRANIPRRPSHKLHDHRELYALRFIGNRFPLRPPRCLDALAHFGKFRFGNIHMKRANRGFVRTIENETEGWIVPSFQMRLSRGFRL